MAGDLIFWGYEPNGRFMDIAHVGIYAGEGKVIDGSSSRLQVVYRNLFELDKPILQACPILFLCAHMRSRLFNECDGGLRSSLRFDNTAIQFHCTKY